MRGENRFTVEDAWVQSFIFFFCACGTDYIRDAVFCPSAYGQSKVGQYFFR